MAKITFLGAGSTVFAKNILGDCLCRPSLQDAEIALYDIDPQRLKDSHAMMKVLNKNINKGRAKITAHCGKRELRTALRDADFVVNAIQVGGYEPCTVTDFEIPKKFGLRQTIADTVGIGGLFRSLRTIPVMLEFAQVMEKVCPNAWFLNYTNPQCALVGAMLRATEIRTVGLCHSVQDCAPALLNNLGICTWDEYKKRDIRWEVGGINHMAWLLSIKEGDKDLYPEIKRRAAKLVAAARKKDGEKNYDMVRLHMMKHFGYYITESSEHNAEYHPYWIKPHMPHLIEEFNIPLDEYPRRCVNLIEGWKKQRKDIVKNKKLSHKLSAEFGSVIMNSIVTNEPSRVHASVLNSGSISNLPSSAIVEVACLVDKNGVQPTVIGDLPEQCAALNRTNINTQLLTIEAALTQKKDAVYHAAMLDPHTAAELDLDSIKKLCDALIKAHGTWLPKYK